MSATLTDVVTSGLSASTFVVHNTQTARTGPNSTSGNLTATVTFDPFNNFHPGEVVNATVTDGIQTALGGVTPGVWRFRTQVTKGSGVFTQSGNSLGSDEERGLALGDLDGDGDLDALAGNINSNDRLWINDGSGNFSQSPNLLTASFTRDVELGDLDGDGDLDAFVLGTISNSVWLNDGAGVFTANSDVMVNSSASSVSLGDLDSDGDLDAFVTNDNSQPNRVWLNKGSGNFTLSSNSLGDTYSTDTELGDLDGDGHLDVFVGRTLNYPNTVWINNGSAVFSASTNSLGSSKSAGVNLGDVGGDGDLDAFVSNILVTEPDQVWLNDGSGIFIQSVNEFPAGRTSIDSGLGDLDGDGDLDAYVIINSQPNRVWINVGPLEFGDAPAPLPTLIQQDGARHELDTGGPRLGATIDIEKNGLVSANADGDDNDGVDDEDGVVFPADVAPSQLTAAVNIDVKTAPGRLDGWVDFNRDGSFDLAREQVFTSLSLSVSAGAHSLSFAVPADAAAGMTTARFRLSTTGGLAPRGRAADGEVEDNQLSVVPPSGSGGFSQSSNSLGGADSFAVSLGDVDGDDDLDAFVGNASPNSVWLNLGSGNFSLGSNSLGSASSAGLRLGDVDGDGDLDAFVANNSYSPDEVWLNNGSGTFNQSSNTLGVYSSNDVDLGDLDGDGDLDAVTVSGYNITGLPNKLWLNDGSGIFSLSGNAVGSGNSQAVRLGDIDRDGDLDVVIANAYTSAYGYGYQYNEVLLNKGDGSFQQGTVSGYSYSYDVALGDLNGDGYLDAFFANTGPNEVWLNTGSGTFSQNSVALGYASSKGVRLGDVDGDGDLDAYVTNDSGDANRIWINNGSASFSQSSNSLGNANSKGVSLGDVDGDGDLDAFTANANGEPNRVWLNVTTDGDSDGVPDAIDKCPSIGNPGQEDLDGDALGNVCDDDVDGDSSCVPPGGQDENDCDPDDDNDGLLDVNEAAAGADPFDPDSDDDGIRDGLDPSPGIFGDNDCDPDGPETLNNMVIMNKVVLCASQGGVTIEGTVQITGSGELQVITPKAVFETEFKADPGGKMSIYSEDLPAPDP